MRAKKERYHHGDLRGALIDTAIELIAERGIAGFSMAEASRRLDVTVAAPYRHFADRDELLTAVAARAAQELAAALAAGTEQIEDPAEQLAGACRAYVRFAADRRALFQALFVAGLDKTGHPELEAASRPVADAFYVPAQALCEGEAAERLTVAVGATAHGHAMLLVDKAFSSAAEAADRAGAAALALVQGREMFAS
jgi:AcrR family transcriptional regulator